MPPSNLYTVMDTPRRAGASVARSSDDEVAVRCEFLNYLAASRHGRTALPAFDNACHLISFAQQVAEIVDEVLKIGLGIVNETDYCAAERRQGMQQSLWHACRRCSGIVYALMTLHGVFYIKFEENATRFAKRLLIRTVFRWEICRGNAACQRRYNGQCQQCCT
jgi:hypothetical protein